MVRLTVAALVTFALMAAAAIAAPIPTPAPGSAMPIAQPTPVNPVQYVVTPGSTGSSAAQNSNFYKVYSDMALITNMLNGCSYIPGAAIGTITAISPLNVAIGSCSSGTGTGATATISLGGIVPIANLPTSPAFSGAVSGASFAGGPFSGTTGTFSGALTATTGTFSGAVTGAGFAGGPHSGTTATFSGGLSASTGSFSNRVTASVDGTTVGYVAPWYSPAGASSAANTHMIYGACSTSSSVSCSIVLSNAAVFTSGGTWACFASVVASPVPVFTYITNGGTIAVAQYNDGASRTAQINFACGGY